MRPPQTQKTEIKLAIVKKYSIVWNITPCRSEDIYWHFWRTSYLHLQGRRESQASGMKRKILVDKSLGKWIERHPDRDGSTKLGWEMD
jgi:hypothetical protein